MEEIDKIVKNAYQLFSGYQPTKDLDACTFCCMSEENAEKIKNFLLQEIPIEVIRDYQDAAKPEKLNFNELKYFAPRFLELVKDYQFPSFEPILSFTRFGYFQDSDWSEEERNLLNQYALVFFKNYIELTKHPEYLTPCEMLLMFHKGNFDLALLLHEWKRRTSPASLRHFSNLLDDITELGGKIKVYDAFADDNFNEKIHNWLTTKEVKEVFKAKIENAILEPKGKFSEAELDDLNWKYEFLD